MTEVRILTGNLTNRADTSWRDQLLVSKAVEGGFTLVDRSFDQLTAASGVNAKLR